MNSLHSRNLILTVLPFTIISLCCARDTITPTNPLASGEILVSSGGRFALGFFTPINSNNHYIGIWYNNLPAETVVWVANRMNPISVTNSSGVALSIGTGGALMLTNQNTTVVWLGSAKTGLTSPVAQLLDSGNFVVRQDGNNIDEYAWQSFDYPTDTLLPGMKLGVDLASGLSWNLTAWRGDDDPSPGEYTLAMDINSYPQLFLYSGSRKKWRSGPWDGYQFVGLSTPYGSYTSFVNTNAEVSFSFYLNYLQIPSRIVVNQSGSMHWFTWLESSGQWNSSWSAIAGQCDNFDKCGPNGVCHPDSSPLCSCPQGFMPKKLGDGCLRKTALDCRNGTDGFEILKGVKLPDTSYSSVNLTSSLYDCQDTCLKNCSCVAYYAYVNIFEDSSGCILWTGDLRDIKAYNGTGRDLYVRVAAADLGSISGNANKNRKEEIAIVLSLTSGMVVVGMGCFLWLRRKKKRNAIIFLRDQSNERTGESNLELPSFDFSIIAAATDSFSDGNKLGEGGYGPVYKGKLGEGHEIAVKRLAETSQQGANEFKNEVMLIAKLQHRNLVRLLGCCIQGEDRMLIYEYMLNKSLDAFLFDKERATLLDWKTRYQIIVGITRGLLYLHHDSRFRIIHRDLKASNILLDKDMNPKISDFGMARIFAGDETDFNTRKVVGTYGYMSPEYALDGIFSMKSDVFSFGVLVLEIISGRRNRGVYAHSPHLNLVAHAWSLWNEGKSSELADESARGSVSSNEVLKCVKIGLLCVQERAEDRPLMSTVIQMLGTGISSLPQPKQPGFIARMDPLETDSSPNKQTSNEMTVTLLDGR